MPRLSTLIVTRSPHFRKIPRAAPQPAGVPVAMTSPGRSVRRVLNWGDFTKSASRQCSMAPYSFYFWDCDDNAWEILANPPGGYSWLFEKGDQEGLGHMSRSF